MTSPGGGRRASRENLSNIAGAAGGLLSNWAGYAAQVAESALKSAVNDDGDGDVGGEGSPGGYRMQQQQQQPLRGGVPPLPPSQQQQPMMMHQQQPQQQQQPPMIPGRGYHQSTLSMGEGTPAMMPGGGGFNASSSPHQQQQQQQPYQAAQVNVFNPAGAGVRRTSSADSPARHPGMDGSGGSSYHQQGSTPHHHQGVMQDVSLDDDNLNTPPPSGQQQPPHQGGGGGGFGGFFAQKAWVPPA